MAGATGLEPATSAVTGQRSNRLSYAPVKGTQKVCEGFKGRQRLFEIIWPKIFKREPSSVGTTFCIFKWLESEGNQPVIAGSPPGATEFSLQCNQGWVEAENWTA